MTKEEAKEHFKNSKCYVNGHIEELIMRLKGVGFTRDPDIDYLNAPFIEITENCEIFPFDGMIRFKQLSCKEISAEEILSLPIQYETFKDGDYVTDGSEIMIFEKYTDEGGFHFHICSFDPMLGSGTHNLNNYPCRLANNDEIIDFNKTLLSYGKVWDIEKKKIVSKKYEPFEKVIVKRNNVWVCSFYSHYGHLFSKENNYHITITHSGYTDDQIVPYNSKTEDLIGYIPQS